MLSNIHAMIMNHAEVLSTASANLKGVQEALVRLDGRVGRMERKQRDTPATRRDVDDAGRDGRGDRGMPPVRLDMNEGTGMDPDRWGDEMGDGYVDPWAGEPAGAHEDDVYEVAGGAAAREDAGREGGMDDTGGGDPPQGGDTDGHGVVDDTHGGGGDPPGEDPSDAGAYAKGIDISVRIPVPDGVVEGQSLWGSLAGSKGRRLDDLTSLTGCI